MPRTHPKDPISTLKKGYTTVLKNLLGRTTTPATSDADQIAEIEQAAKRLGTAAQAAELKANAARAQADYCRANLKKVGPAQLHDALTAEQAAEKEHSEAMTAHTEFSATVQQRMETIRNAAAEAAAKAALQEYNEALGAYRVQYQNLMAPAFEVRRLAQLAGVFEPRWDPADLLFDRDSDVSIKGEPMPMTSFG